MPAKSEAQKRLMDAAAHSPAFAKKVGVPSKVAKDFSEASIGMKFKKDGAESQAKRQSVNTTQLSKGGKTMKLKSLIYRLLSISNDLNAIQRGPKAIGKRLVRKAGWRKFASIMRRI